MTVSVAFAGSLATSPELRPAHFRRIADQVHHVAGIRLAAGKEGLVRSRLAPRLRELGLATFEDYLDALDADASGAELSRMVDALTTNKTSFFRENDHFAFLQRDVLPQWAARATGARIWSAGCSSGEEPYTLAMLLREALPADRATQARILATDISARVLARARKAEYAEELVRDVPPALARRHFAPASGDRMVQVVPATRALVRFARLNLMAEWPMQGPFDAIFCRNVMIYFDRETQERLVQRYSALLAPGGQLFVGHSESLTGIVHDLAYVQPAVYRKQG